ncbi:hypothetical protein PR202_ga29956 [Eleusine coracana subsp. coracana]|uniref:Uncharacterized protein n=1 Tax=Eleusine coracana subsp. coracana TaxID=191504 RepID=A0AAV5DNN4_ELECO|nr:hypothetical protein PR202_ga29956 [Eleusine coracana subsp. coracana]
MMSSASSSSTYLPQSSSTRRSPATIGNTSPPLLPSATGRCSWATSSTPRTPLLRPRSNQRLRPTTPTVFVPLDAAALCLFFAFAPDASGDFPIHEVRLGLVLLLQRRRPEVLVPRILVLDPTSRHRALLPPLSRDTVPDD